MLSYPHGMKLCTGEFQILSQIHIKVRKPLAHKAKLTYQVVEGLLFVLVGELASAMK